MNTDKLYSINAQAAVQAAYVAVSAIQQLSPEEQLAGVSLLLTVMAKNLNQDVSQLINMSTRIARDADSNYTTEIRALNHYVQDNLK